MGNGNRHPLQVEAERVVRAGCYPVEWHREGLALQVRTQYHGGLDCFRVIIGDLERSQFVTLLFRNAFRGPPTALEALMLEAADRKGIRLARDHKAEIAVRGC